MSDLLAQQKKERRAEMRQRHGALGPVERAERSRRLVDRLAALPAWRAASRVLLYAPLPSEPDLDLLWGEGALFGKQAAYPRVEGKAMRLYFVGSPDELERTRWGLREPSARTAHEGALDDFGVILVPGLAFDAAGGRLGRGGGYYDRLLAQRDPTRTRLIGVAFAFQVSAEPLPLVAHDVRVDEVCTD